MKPWGKYLLAVRVAVALSARGAGPLDDWTRLNPLPSDSALNGVAYGGGLFVVVGDSGTILTSTDATNWTPQNPVFTNTVAGGDNALSSVAYGNGRFVAVGASYDRAFNFVAALVLTSADGTNWTQHPVAPGVPLTGAAYGNGQFVAAGGGLETNGVTYDGMVLSSPDGLSWFPRFSTPGSGTANYPTRVRYANGLFLAVGYGGTILTSPDGTTWTSRNSGVVDQVTDVAFGKGGFVALWTAMTPAGENSGTLVSSDGAVWMTGAIGISSILNGIRYANQEFVAVGSGVGANATSGSILVAADGFAWGTHLLGSNDVLHCVGFGNGRFVATGDLGTLFVSGEVVALDATILPTGSVQGTINGSAGQTHAVEVSTNLVDWVTLTNLTGTNATMAFSDPAATGFNRRFYRAVSP